MRCAAPGGWRRAKSSRRSRRPLRRAMTTKICGPIDQFLEQLLRATIGRELRPIDAFIAKDQHCSLPEVGVGFDALAVAVVVAHLRAPWAAFGYGSPAPVVM